MLSLFFTASHGLQLFYIFVFRKDIDKVPGHEAGIACGRDLLLAPFNINQERVMGPFDILNKLISNSTATANSNFHHVALF